MDAIVSEWIASKTRDDVLEILDTHGVPVSPILSIRDIFEHPQFKARENIVEVHHPRLGKVKVPGIIPKFEKHLEVSVTLHLI